MSSMGHVGQACARCVERVRAGISRVQDRLHDRFQTDRGGSLVEYALLISLIALVAMSAMRFFSSSVQSKFNCSESAINSETGVASC